MTTRLSDAVITAIHEIVLEAETNNEILDAYGMAERIKRKFPEEDLVSGELIAAMLRSGLQAIEFAPTGLLIEVILPPGTPSEDEATAEASLKLDMSQSPFQKKPCD
jgi:hypothetical protein